MSEGPQVQESVWDRLAPAYSLAGPDHFSVFARRLVEAVPLDPGATVLDLACGASALTFSVASAAPAARLVAADRSVPMLRQAWQVPEYAAHAIEVFAGRPAPSVR